MRAGSTDSDPYCVCRESSLIETLRSCYGEYSRDLSMLTLLSSLHVSL